MGIQDITYKIQQEAGVTTTDNKRFDQTAKLTFQATSNAPTTDNVYTMRIDPAAPTAGFPHPFIPNIFSSGINCRKVSSVLYEFDVSYTGRGKDGRSPLDEPLVVEFDFAISEEPYDQGFDGKPIVMVTGEPPDPPLKDTQYDLMMILSRNLKWVDPDMFSLYAGRTNSDTFLNLPPGTCKITHPPKARSAEWEGQIYWQCTMGITVRRGEPGLYEDKYAWYKRTLAQGFYYKAVQTAANGGTRIVHARINGEKVTKPILHYKDTGRKIPFDSDGQQDLSAAEWYLFPPKKAPMPFAALRIE